MCVWNQSPVRISQIYYFIARRRSTVVAFCTHEKSSYSAENCLRQLTERSNDIARDSSNSQRAKPKLISACEGEMRVPSQNKLRRRPIPVQLFATDEKRNDIQIRLISSIYSHGVRRRRYWKLHKALAPPVSRWLTGIWCSKAHPIFNMVPEPV